MNTSKRADKDFINSRLIAWHTLSSHVGLETLNSNQKSGLTTDEALDRLSRYGRNEIAPSKSLSYISIFLNQFRSPIVIILLIAIAISAILGDILDSIIIAIIIMITTIVGFIQEYRSEKTVETLRLLSSPMSTVVRDNKEVSIRSSQLVPGDIVIVIEGDRVSADSLLIENHNITTNEAALTGESLPVEKSIQKCITHGIPLHERRNILYAGTMVTSGRGKALVFGTGVRTELGKIATQVESVSRDKTPFQKKMDQIGRLLLRITIIVCIIIILTGIYRDNPLIEMLLWGISIAVAAIPEALPAVITTSLAAEVSRLAKRHALLKTLPSAETLGSSHDSRITRATSCKANFVCQPSHRWIACNSSRHRAI